jgi:multiple antibiotic resistance protein
VVQVAGGLVVASMGWNLLNRPDPEKNSASAVRSSPESLEDKIFYPLTFPITAGPGTIVVALTLSAHASTPSLLNTVLANLGLMVAAMLIAVVMYFSYAYADWVTARLPPTITQGILRVISFILLCIGSEIVWNGLQNLMKK